MKKFINSKVYPINTTLTPQLLDAYINIFWNDIFANIPNRHDSHLLLMVKVEFDSKEMNFKCLANLRHVDLSEKVLFIKYILENLALATDTYTNSVIRNIVFTYIQKTGKVTEKERSLLLPPPPLLIFSFYSKIK